ncbi:MAG TPA: hypothetical protein V6D17_18350 [Candidatus Obscuribacterales bacterium]
MEARASATIHELKEKLPNDKECWEFIIQKGIEEGIVRCHYCGCREIKRGYGERKANCSQCKKEIWVLADTFFADIKKIFPYLAAITLCEKGLKVSIAAFSKMLKVAYSTAWLIDKKLNFIVQDVLQNESKEIPSASFISLFSRRSRQTPAGRHPLAEESGWSETSCEHWSAQKGAPDSRRSHDEAAQPLDMATSALLDELGSADNTTVRDVSDLGVKERQVFETISSCPIASDEILSQTGLEDKDLSVILTILEIDGLITRLPGDRYVRVDACNAKQSDASPSTGNEIDEQTGNLIERFIVFVHRIFFGISRKYVQLFLAGHWCYEDRRRWGIGSLFKACLHSGPFTRDMILSYDSPALLKACPLDLCNLV